MKKIYLFIISIVFIALVVIITKTIIDKQYRDRVHSILNTKIRQVEILHRNRDGGHRRFVIHNNTKIKQFIKKLNTDKWKPKYIELDSFFYWYQITLNENKTLYITRLRDSYLCDLEGRFYYIPQNVYSYLETYQ